MKRKIGLAVFCLALAVLLFSAGSVLRDLRRFYYEGVFARVRHRHVYPPSISDANYIQPWMTFDYINVSFKLPAGYLKTQFGITDKNYPKVALGRIGREKGIPGNVFIGQVKDAVRQYLSANSNH